MTGIIAAAAGPASGQRTSKPGVIWRGTAPQGEDGLQISFVDANGAIIRLEPIGWVNALNLAASICDAATSHFLTARHTDSREVAA